MDSLYAFDLYTSGVYFLKILAAFVLALPVAWERETADRTMGLRTFPLVSVASCGFALVGQAVVGADPASQARILQGLMTGIGFIGGGAILKGRPGPPRRPASGRPASWAARSPTTASKSPGSAGNCPPAPNHTASPSGVSAFSQYTVAAQESLVKIDAAVSLDKAALFGCAVLTGVGAVVNTAQAIPATASRVLGWAVWV